LKHEVSRKSISVASYGLIKSLRLPFVKLSELIPGFPPVPSVLDLFRFRPHVNLVSFGPEERILSSGGEQVFFGLSPELEFSTGRPDGTGGDGAQASHWKLIVVNQNQPQ
jgi:hypothetical protein